MSDEGPKDEVDLLEQVDRAINVLQAHPDPEVRAEVDTLLKGIDAVHRTGLERLIAAVHGMAGDAFLNRLIGDPAIRLLLMSYNLIAVDRRLQAEEALDKVRGHLHAHGVDVEIREVVGGVVYVKLHGVKNAAQDEAVRRDLENALRDGLLGFQELVVGGRPSEKAETMVPISSLKVARRPKYERAIALEELPASTLRAIEIAGIPILLARVGDEVFALHNRCGDSPLPLEYSRLENEEIRCSWHSCRYDVRSGRRLGVDGERLRVYPVRVEQGEIQIAMGVVA